MELFVTVGFFERPSDGEQRVGVSFAIIGL